MNVEGAFGTNVKVEPSTFRPGDVWLFIRNSPHGAVKGALHLDKQSAAELRDALEVYLND